MVCWTQRELRSSRCLAWIQRKSSLVANYWYFLLHMHYSLSGCYFYVYYWIAVVLESPFWSWSKQAKRLSHGQVSLWFEILLSEEEKRERLGQVERKGVGRITKPKQYNFCFFSARKICTLVDIRARRSGAATAEQVYFLMFLHISMYIYAYIYSNNCYTYKCPLLVMLFELMHSMMLQRGEVMSWSIPGTF